MLKRTTRKICIIRSLSVLCLFHFVFVCSLSSLVKSTENGNGVTFRSGADVSMDIGVSGFGGDSAIDRAMQMVRFSSEIRFKNCVLLMLFFI